MSAVAMASAPVKVLWMDDEPASIEDYRNMLETEQGRHYLSIDIATSIKEAREKLRSDDYAALIVDCRMDPYSIEENGARFLHRVNEEQKYFPTFVYSGYLEEFRRYLKDTHPIKTVNKAETSFERPISGHWFFKAIREAGETYLQVKDYRPEWITFKDFMVDPQKHAIQTSNHWKKHGHWINVKMKADDLVWAVVCGDNIVGGSKDLFDFPNDERLIEYGEKYNLVPFPYSNPSLPEDIHLATGSGCEWNQTSRPSDYYPAFVAAIGETELIDDFDTGAQHTFVSDELISPGIFDHWRSSEMPHLGQPFKHIAKRIALTIVDSSGVTRSKQMTVVVIKDWRKSTFIHFNDKRKILFGRDILRAFELEVCLNSQKRITQIKFL